MKAVKIQKSEIPSSIVNVKVCDTFFSRLRGLMFSRELQPDSGVMMADKVESKANASIHMFFMKYDITVLWLDKNMVVVDKALAKKWHPYYAPKKPAQYILELHESKFPEYAIGDQLVRVEQE